MAGLMAVLHVIKHASYDLWVNGVPEDESSKHQVDFEMEPQVLEGLGVFKEILVRVPVSFAVKRYLQLYLLFYL